MAPRSRKSRSKRQVIGYDDIRSRSTALSERIEEYLKSLKKTGGGRMEAWQGSYPIAGTRNWNLNDNICSHPGLANQVFSPPGMVGGKRRKRKSKKRSKHSGGGYGVSESFFGRRPVGYIGPLSSPYPNKTEWKAIGSGKYRSKRKSR